MREFPQMLYRGGDETTIVSDVAGRSAALAAGWVTVEVYLGHKLDAPEDQAQSAPAVVLDDADALRAALEAEGIKFDRRWGAARLRAALGGA